MRIWEAGLAAFLLMFFSTNAVSGEEGSLPSFLKQPFSFCVGELDRRIKEIDPAEIFNLHLRGELYAEEQKLPKWIRKGCEEGIENWAEDLEIVKVFRQKLEHLIPRIVLRPYAVVERKDGVFDLKIAPEQKELKKYPDWRIKVGLDVDTELSELPDGNYGKLVTPTLKVTALYKDALEIRAKANPLAEIYRLKISSGRHYFDVVRPEISYRNEKRGGGEKHLVESVIRFKIGVPNVHAGISGEMNLEDASDWGIRLLIYGRVNWECWIVPSWCRKD